MALFKIKRGLAANLPTNSVEGYCYVTTDDKKFYIDIATAETASNSSRICLNAAYADSAGSVAWSNVTGKTAYTTRWPKWSEVTDKTTFSGGTTTLAWGQTHTIATVDGNAVKVTMPANPNTDHYAWADITGKPATATSWPTWDQVTGKPTSFTPASHTHSYAGSSSSGGVANSAATLSHKSLNSTTINSESGSFAFSGSGAPWDGTDWVGLQIGDSVDKFQFSANGNTLVFRQNDNGGTNTSWSDWVTMLTSANYTSYTVTKTGSGASGTWGISITGNAASATYLKDRTNSTASYLNYGAAGLAASAITWLCCWNGYEVRAISKAEMANAVDSAHKWVRLGGDTMTGQLYINLDQDVGLNQNGSLVIGNKGGVNIGIDGNEIMARNNSKASTLYINSEGGLVYIGSGGLEIDGGGIKAQHGHIFNVGTNEFNWIPDGYNNTMWLNYETFNRANNGNVTQYLFGNGKHAWNTTHIYAGAVHNAVWNDFAEYRESEIIEPGRVLISNGRGQMILAEKRLCPGAKVISDTFGCSVGESDTAKTPLGVAGRVLVYPYQESINYHVGDAVCTAPNGTVDIMTREEIQAYPDCIVGIVDEVPAYDHWEQWHTCYKEEDKEPNKTLVANVEVKGRIWIYVR